MSDCSTAAMNPKKRPEVCPNCGKPIAEYLNEYESTLVHLHCPYCDCSITKEFEGLHKTCGNCSELYMAPRCNRFGHVSLDDNDTLDDDGMTFADYCLYWKKRRDELTLKQRHQQLEQVAKELMQYIEFLESRHDVQPTSSKAQMYQKLHKLGVSLDD